MESLCHAEEPQIARKLIFHFCLSPELLEGEAGVGKTEVAKSLAAVHEAELIRLQCYEGLDQNATL